MPKAAVHKHCDPLAWKSKVRLSGYAIVPTPPRDVHFLQQSEEPQFSADIALRANPRHQRRTRPFC